MTVEPEAKELWWCPAPTDALPSRGRLRERLAASSRRRDGLPFAEPVSIIDLLRHLGDPRSSVRVTAQKRLEEHAASPLRWRDSNEVMVSGPWFIGTLNLVSKWIWRAGPRGQYNRFEDLAHDVYVAYFQRIGKDAAGGLAIHDWNRPWTSLCGYLRTIGQNKLKEQLPPGISHTATLTVRDLKRTQEALAEARAALMAGGSPPAWLAALAGEHQDRAVLMTVINALLDPGNPGASLTLTEDEAALARKLISVRPPRLSAADRDEDDEEDADDDDGDDQEDASEAE